jgi:hypothetical protein
MIHFSPVMRHATPPEAAYEAGDIPRQMAAGEDDGPPLEPF